MSLVAGLHERMLQAGRMQSSNWDVFDAKPFVYQPARLTPARLTAGYDWAYREF
ncbi:MAG TPA: hypothetical protein VGL22_18665 [Terracidiphilus sp.]|jgi:hypothetical protein